jgi:phenylpropionate dioxygenase-like ring-hydroxylating dioxygenase large terminal subunit
MQQAEQLNLADRMFNFKASGTQTLADDVFINPVSIYTDQEYFARERELFFRKMPLFMGLSNRIPKPGDYFTNNFTGQPILIMRGENGEVNAFLNVCRHRGTRLMEDECGQGKRRFSCPYHGWTFDTAGTLVNIPQEEKFGAVNKAELGLTRLPVAEKYGLIFVRPVPGAPIDIDRQLGGLAPEFAAYGFDTYHHHRSVTVKHDFNWKIVQDTFLEIYHLPVLHRTTVNPYIDSSLYVFDPYDLNLRFAIPRRNFEAFREQPSQDKNFLPHLAIVYLLFPNTTFIWQGTHAEAWTAYPDKDNIDKTVIEFSQFTPQAAATDSARRFYDKNFDLAIATVEKEDFPMSELLNAGFFTGAQKEVVYGRNEPALQYYHQTLRRAMKGLNY